ncbi:Polygalacturonase [Vitis vinifera]|uniref:Polygalacturonase n=1 Tax=Vitis vinifera TaxID=29760 RepID=A0A438GI38_VITVI|nr:Polygalacturonase [Vitis vinifera]
MGLKLNITATSLLLLLASAAKALLKACGNACASPMASTVMIPEGTYALGQITIGGPCKAPINFIVQGTMKAPEDTSRFKAEAGWIAFQQIDQFTLFGGVFYGQQIDQQNLRFNFITNSMVNDITSRDSKQFHINLLGCKNLTFYNIAISAPEESLNTD